MYETIYPSLEKSLGAPSTKQQSEVRNALNARFQLESSEWRSKSTVVNLHSRAYDDLSAGVLCVSFLPLAPPEEAEPQETALF